MFKHVKSAGAPPKAAKGALIIGKHRAGAASVDTLLLHTMLRERQLQIIGTKEEKMSAVLMHDYEQKRMNESAGAAGNGRGGSRKSQGKSSS